MRFSLGNFLYGIKQIVGGKNGDDTPVVGTLIGSGTSSAQSADGGIKVDKPIPLADVTNATDLPAILDSTGGIPGTTFAAIAAGASYAQADMVAAKNALSQIALQLNALNRQLATSVSSVPAIAVVAGATTIGTFSFAVPRDYDEASDHLAVFLEANSTNADASITITGTATIAPIASQTGTAIVATTKAAVTATAPFQTANLNVTQLVQVFSINLSGYGLKRNDIVSVALAFAGTTSGIDYVYSVTNHYDSYIVSYNDTDATGSPNGTTSIVQPGFGNPLR